jgi:hypothetical protein
MDIIWFILLIKTFSAKTAFLYGYPFLRNDYFPFSGTGFYWRSIANIDPCKFLAIRIFLLFALFACLMTKYGENDSLCKDNLLLTLQTAKDNCIHPISRENQTNPVF